ncbi:MAG: ATP-binding protein [Lewinella sp.]|uniref:ATP-binding protein n=1 Tax=Lewinella sp. TaxID=2004506 RepID=UPI003D6A7FF1
MALEQAHQGYYYQDILSAYLVAEALANGKDENKFFFDQKKTPKGQEDKFDDISIETAGQFQNFQVKYSNNQSNHIFTKSDISSSAQYDLALHDLYRSWVHLHQSSSEFRLCLAWDHPKPNDKVNKVLVTCDPSLSLISGTTCFKVSIDKLWDRKKGIPTSWKALRKAAITINRNDFEIFLNDLIIEIGYPKSSLLQSEFSGLESLLFSAVRKIGIGTYPNDHLSVDHVVHKLCNLTRHYRSTRQNKPISVLELAKQVGIVLTNGAIEQNFPVEYAMLVETPDRIEAVLNAIQSQKGVIVKAEPGAGKSWFISNLEKHYRKHHQETTVVKHYCYTELGDPLQLRRVTVNAMYGSLIDQLVMTDEELRGYKTMRWGSNFDELNRLLKNISRPTLIIIDGIDHIWRVYQRNRGGLTEDETSILKALAILDLTNKNVQLLVVSQPIQELESLSDFVSVELPRISKAFVQALLTKHAISDVQHEETSLSHLIHEKSQGNALYTKYLVDEAIKHQGKNTLQWLFSLPEYTYNLEAYYNYLYAQIEEGKSVPYALCGAAFFLSSQDLKEITGWGDIVNDQIAMLRPVLRYAAPYGGYMIYHESFKRFIVEKLKEQGADTEKIMYSPLIQWLETKDFFESKKAYAHLLKLYFEVEDYAVISDFINEDFITKSLINTQPFSLVTSNFKLLSKSLAISSTFQKAIIINELSKVIWELENHAGYLNYLIAVKDLKGRQAMYSLLSYDTQQLASQSDIQNILIEEAYAGETDIPWSLVPNKGSIPKEKWMYTIVKALSIGDYKTLEHYYQTTSEKPEYSSFHESLLEEFQKWIYHFGDEWVDHVPSYLKYLERRIENPVNPLEVVKKILKTEHFHHSENWKETLFQLRLGIRQCKEEKSDELINEVIDQLSNRNWFFNWLIYMVKTVAIKENESYSDDEVQEAFSYLVRDLAPFKGTPRTCDLFGQIAFIRDTFRRGLDLCLTDKSKSICIQLLEKVTETTTSIQRSYSGPLTVEAFLEIAQEYLPGDKALLKYEDYYDPLGSRRVYSDLTTIAFNYCRVLTRNKRIEEAEEAFLQGIEYLTAYGYRKDRTLSELLYPSTPYQKQYGTLSPTWFFELYKLSMTVTSHTDGKSTQSYPIEWFNEFVKVYPKEGLSFLIAETLESPVANYHQETQLYDLLKDCDEMFDATSWFLLVRTIPIASSETILHLALDKIHKIDQSIKDTYLNWVKTLPELAGVERHAKFSKSIVERYKEVFEIELAEKINAEEEKEESLTTPPEADNDIVEPFPTESFHDALAYLEKENYNSEQVERIKKLLTTLSTEERKQLIRSLASRNVSRSNKDKDRWLENLFEHGTEDWIYLRVTLFVYFTDGWFQGLHEEEYLQEAYDFNQEKTISYLNEIVGIYVSDGRTQSIAKNLITSLANIGAKESIVQPLLFLIKKIVTKRLPDTAIIEVKESLYTGLLSFSQSELVVALLISRFKTLTTIKTQSVIYGLIFFSIYKKESLLKPIEWAFKNNAFLLPIHRAFLLQIMLENFDLSELPDSLLGTLINMYPTGYFLEDRIIYDLLDGKLKKENAPNVIEYPADPIDHVFLSHYNPKYTLLRKVGISEKGVTNAFRYKRDEIIEEYGDHYYDRVAKVMPYLVPNADAIYSIVNRKFYDELWRVADLYCEPFFSGFHFLSTETSLMVSSHAPRPKEVPNLSSFEEDFSVVNAIESAFTNKWITIASIEEQITGEKYREKECYSTITCYWSGECKPDKETFLYSLTPMTERGFATKNPVIKDQIVSYLKVTDFFEQATLVFLSPFVLSSLSLKIDNSLHNGLCSKNEKGEKIVIFKTWKEKYTGSISNGNEHPFISGCCIQIRADYYEKLLNLYPEPIWYVKKKASFRL